LIDIKRLGVQCRVGSIANGLLKDMAMSKDGTVEQRSFQQGRERPARVMRVNKFAGSQRGADAPEAGGCTAAGAGSRARLGASVCGRVARCAASGPVGRYSGPD
jgi:hypothetical protein